MSIKLPSASATKDGIIENATQTIAGAKTFNDVLTFKSSSGATTAGSYDTTAAWTLGPSTSTGINHRVNGSIFFDSAPAFSSSSYRWIGNDNFGHLFRTSVDSYWFIGGYYDGTDNKAKTANTAIARINLNAGTADSSTFIDFQKLQTTQGSYTITAGATANAATSLATATYAGAWTFGATSGSSLTHIFQSNSDTTLSVRATAAGGQSVIESKSTDSNGFVKGEGKNSTTTRSGFLFYTAGSERWAIVTGQSYTGMTGLSADELGFSRTSGATLLGKIGTGGAWLFGPSGGGQSHSFTSQSLTGSPNLVSNAIDVGANRIKNSGSSTNITGSGGTATITVPSATSGAMYLVCCANTGDTGLFLVSTGSAGTFTQLVSSTNSSWAAGTGAGTANKLNYSGGVITLTNNNAPTFTYYLIHLWVGA